MKRLGNLLLLGSILLTGCYNDYEGPRVNGNGDIVSITRNITDFEEIDLRSVADVTINITSSPSGELRITGESNIIPRIETDVRNGRLVIDQDRFVRNFEKISIEVDATSLTDLNLSGVGNILVNGLNIANNIDINLSGNGKITLESESEDIDAYLSGVGEINLAGTTFSQTDRISGSGKIHAFDLISDKTDAAISGVGDIYVNTTKELKAVIDGTGSILYKGNPPAVSVRTHIAGKIELVN